MGDNRFEQFLQTPAPANRFAQFSMPPVSTRERIEAALSAGESGISPERQAATARMNEQAQGAIEQAGREQLIRDHPIGARAAVAMQGVPFVGEYADEFFDTIGGDGERIRAAQRGMEEEHQVQTGALRMGAGVISTLPVTALATASRATRGGALAVSAFRKLFPAGSSLAGNAVRGALVGGAAGAVEGAVSGYGAGQGDNRGQMALERSAIGGGLGTVLGGAAPVVSAGLRNLFSRMRTSDIQTIAREFGISPEAARTVREALEAENFTRAQAAIQRAGGRAMLVDAGESSRTLLDGAMTSGPGAARVASDALGDRTQAGGREWVELMDRFFGRPEGVETARRTIRTSTSTARQAAYDAAFSQPVNYTGRIGARFDSLWERVPQQIRRIAANNAQMDGTPSLQRFVSLADDGTPTITRPADVRQWDFIARELDEIGRGSRGASGGIGADGVSARNLSREIRDTLRSSVPGYTDAVALGRDTIRRSQAVEFGASLLRPSTTREQAADTIRRMTAAERTAARSGLRSHIDDLMSRTRATLTGDSMEAREAITAWRALSSRQSRDNIAALMGGGRANGLVREIERIATDFELSAAVAANSRTAVRTSVHRTISESAQPGILDVLSESGSPAEAGRRIVQALTGAEPGARAAREAGIAREITEALTRTRGAREASRIMSVVENSIGSEPISRGRAEHIARLLTTGGATAAYQQGSQRPTTR